MRAIVIPEPWKAVTAEREVPVPKQGEVLLKMVCGGICGSDLASYRGQSAYVSYPRTIGHEFAAEVVEVGENPYGIKKGMLVMVAPDKKTLKKSVKSMFFMVQTRCEVETIKY